MSTDPTPSIQPLRVRDTELTGGEPRERYRERIARITLDSMVQFVGLLDAQGTVLEINQVALDAVGITLADVEGKPFWTTFWWQVSEEMNATLRESISRAAEGEFVRWDAEIYGRAGGTETIIIDASLCPVKDERGQVVFICAEGRDITEKKAYEREIARQREELAQLDRLKTQFFANISHEFRTPLTLMMGPLEDALADPEGLSLANRERLELARRNALRQLKLVNTLLDFSRIEDGRIQASYEPLDLSTLTAELASVFRSAIERAGMRLEVHCLPLSEPVYVDREMWEKIVLNLLSNAFKFTFSGEIEVSLQPAGSEVQLTVRDSGTGIPADELPRLFERFHRVKGAAGRSFEGSGIGLALVQELARLHGGRVDVESEVGRGSAFRVTLPLGKAHLPADRIEAARTLASTGLRAEAVVAEALRWLPDERFPEAASPEEPVPAPLSLTPAGERILLADDNADMRDYVRRLLTGYEVETVSDGAAALSAARQRPPDLVLTDVMMPGLDGFELLRELRADPRTREVPVILLSARAGEESRIEGLAAGADDYLIKPFSARELLARVQAHLQLTRLRRESRSTMGRQNERLKLLWKAAGVLLTTTEPDAMLRGVFAEIRELLDLDCYFSFMVTETRDALRLVSCAGISEEAARSISWIEFGQTVSGTVARQRKSIVVAHVQESPDPIMHVVQDYGLRAYACNPLLAGGELLGTLSFGSRTRDYFEPEEVEFLETISQYVTVAYERMRLVQQLRDEDRRKDEFLATLAHELRNPLAPIRNGLELIRLAGSNPATLEQSRSMIERQIRQMVRLVDDLLDVSRISRDKLELRRERVELAAIVQSAVETSRPLIDAARHELHVSLPAEPVLLQADPVRLAQAFSNLLNNAAKYSGQGGRIALTAELQGGEVVVRIRDNGIGIPADQLPHVFDLFVQVGRSRDASQGGLGIGLTLVRRLIEMHGGSVSATSAGPGQGSEFSLRLPVAAVSAPLPAGNGTGCPEAGREVPGKEGRDEPVAAATGLRVLVVDDNRDAADSLAEVLEHLGYEVKTTYDGLQAVEAIREYQPRLVLMDLGMPGLNGYKAARRIRALPEGRDVMLVAVTGWGQEEDKRRSREASFDRHMVKPVDLAALEQLLAGL
jgi:PAS domain S-box-containing protein